MHKQLINRRQFGIWVVALLALKLGAVVVVQIAPGALRWLQYLDTPIAVVLAFVVGARFADAGWSRWLGLGLVLLIMVVLPIVLVFTSMSRIARASNPIDAMPESLLLATVALLALLIVAAIPRSVEAAPPERLKPKF
jgi:hypothetical protein